MRVRAEEHPNEGRSFHAAELGKGQGRVACVPSPSIRVRGLSQNTPSRSEHLVRARGHTPSPSQNIRVPAAGARFFLLILCDFGAHQRVPEMQFLCIFHMKACISCENRRPTQGTLYFLAMF